LGLLKSQARRAKGTPQVKRSAIAGLVLDAGRESLISFSGALLIQRTIAVTGLDRGLSVALAPWRPDRARHDPGKVLLDLATTLALGGDCVADIAALRAQPALFGPVASDPTISRLVAGLAGDVDAAVAAVRAARSAARARVWSRRRPLAGRAGSRDGGQRSMVVVDIDATLVTAHSEKEHAQPTFKRGFGFAPMCAFVDHGEQGGFAVAPGRRTAPTAGGAEPDPRPHVLRPARRRGAVDLPTDRPRTTLTSASRSGPAGPGAVPRRPCQP
jgi:hypothetical protein